MASVVELLIGGGLTLTGGAAGALLQAHLQRKQRLEEQAEKRRESRREKAERVFQELKDLVAAHHMQHVHALELSLRQPNSEKPERPAVPSSAILDALVSIYFPACRETVKQFQAECQAIFETAGDSIRAAGGLDAEPKTIVGIHVLMAQELSNRAAEFADKLRDAMRPEIESLW